MKVKTSELTGVALDWAVCVCEGESPSRYTQYSTDWAQAGPIVEREKIELGHMYSDRKFFWIATRSENGALSEESGPTPLIAAMRCYVASQLGDEIEIPEELQ
jgi:hypothetical protein